MPSTAELPSRAVLALSGADRVAFLNGLVSNDVAAAAPGGAVWAALLTAQGKWLADFFIFAEPDRLLVDCEAAQAAMLAQRLGRYRLRADVAIAATAERVYAAWNVMTGPTNDTAAPDPRLPAAGWRILGRGLPCDADAEDYDRHRLALGLPDGSRDMEAEKSVLLEAGFDELGGISWTKGCYMGQELTARTRYRGLVKRRLVPVSAAGSVPSPGTPILHHDREVGVMRSGNGGIGLALLRLEALGGAALQAGGVEVTAHRPAWMRLPEDVTA